MGAFSWVVLVVGLVVPVAAGAQPAPDAGRPRSDGPLVDGGGVRPVPDSGVIAPPRTESGTPVIRPPAVGTMPVIPPPGSPGGDRMLVPK